MQVVHVFFSFFLNSCNFGDQLSQNFFGGSLFYAFVELNQVRILRTVAPIVSAASSSLATNQSMHSEWMIHSQFLVQMYQLSGNFLSSELISFNTSVFATHSSFDNHLSITLKLSRVLGIVSFKPLGSGIPFLVTSGKQTHSSLQNILGQETSSWNEQFF